MVEGFCSDSGSRISARNVLDTSILVIVEDVVLDKGDSNRLYASLAPLGSDHTWPSLVPLYLKACV